jgi:hypothetical protein
MFPGYGDDMTCIIRWVLVLAMALAVARGAQASDMLTPGDLAWLSTSLNLPADSPLIATLNETQKARLHDLIAAARTGSERKRQDVVNFLTTTVGDTFEEMLQQAGQLPPPPTQLGASGEARPLTAR